MKQYGGRNILGRLRRWAVRLSAVALLVIFSVLRIWDPVPVEALRLRTFDLFQIIQPRTQSINPVVIVDLDESKFEKYAYKQFPARNIRTVEDERKWH